MQTRTFGHGLTGAGSSGPAFCWNGDLCRQCLACNPPSTLPPPAPQKPDTVREATAGATVVLGPEVYRLVEQNALKKGDVLTTAQLAGVMGAKHTPLLIPLCHPIMLSGVDVNLRLEPERWGVAISARARTTGPTGVEMEALTAASVAALTVYDMCKAASKSIVISDVRLVSKTGGKSGAWSAGAGACGACDRES